MSLRPGLALALAALVLVAAACSDGIDREGSGTVAIEGKAGGGGDPGVAPPGIAAGSEHGLAGSGVAGSHAGAASAALGGELGHGSSAGTSGAGGETGVSGTAGNAGTAGATSGTAGSGGMGGGAGEDGAGGAASSLGGASGKGSTGGAGGKGGSPDPAPACKKHLTVVYSVGTGAGAARSLSNGCWTVVDADGAANSSFRKCSTSNFQVKNPDAPNYSYDDTNPSRPASQDQAFLAACSKGATGDGYEFLAHRGGWRLLHADQLRAYFAELYGDATDDVDSLNGVAGVYPDAPEFKAHAGHVFPMINIGPSPSAHLEGKIGAATKSLCAAIDDGGYFGTYVATWDQPMTASDPRVKSLAKALNDCTGM